MSVTPIRRVTDADLLALTLRGFGYVDPDEIVELDECIWELAAQLSRVPVPRTAVRCAVVRLFELPVGVSSQSPERSCPPETRSSATAPEPVDRSWSSGRGAVTGSTSESASWSPRDRKGQQRDGT